MLPDPIPEVVQLRAEVVRLQAEVVSLREQRDEAQANEAEARAQLAVAPDLSFLDRPRVVVQGSLPEVE